MDNQEDKMMLGITSHQKKTEGRDSRKLHCCGLIRKYLKRSIGSEYKESKDMLHAIELAADFLGRITKKRGLIICGKLGNGKTTLSNAVRFAMGELSMNGEGYYYHVNDGQRIWFITADDLVRPFIAGEKPKNYLRLFEDKFVFVDDIGREPVYVNIFGSKYSPIIDLICSRYGNRLTTVLTSNLSPASIKERYGERVYDRIKEDYVYIDIEDESFR